MQISRNALGVSLIALTTMLAAQPGIAHAQTAGTPAATTPAPTAQDDNSVGAEVVVTGTSIRGKAPIGSSMLQMSRNDIAGSPAINTAKLLQESPQVLNVGVSDTARTTSSGSKNIVYGSSINLRGVGAYATLTLLNGHRMVPVGTVGGTVDPSNIPAIALERIEIVADGASAIYGSDAVTGVANLILRRNVEGVEANVQRGFGSHYQEYLASVIAGHHWDSGQFTISAQHSYHTRLKGIYRDFYTADLRSRGGADTRQDQCSPGTITIGTTNYAIPAGGATPTNLVAGTTNKCDLYKDADLVPQQEINNAAFTFDQDLTPDSHFYADGYFGRRITQRDGASAFQNLTVPSTNAFYVRPAGSTATSETVRFAFTNESHINDYIQSQAYQVNAGIDTKLGGTWNMNIGGGYGRSTDLSTVYAYQPNAANLAAALASSNPATAFNPFGTSPNSASVISSVFDSLQLTPGTSRIFDFKGTVDGTLVTLPGGDLKVAIGGEYYNYHIRTSRQQGTTTALVYTQDDHLQRDVKSVYVEASIPIFGPGNAVPGIQSLDLDLAGRLDKYSDVGTTKNPKIGIEWKPVEGLKLHGSYGTSFRAPLLTQIVNPGTGLYINTYFDPTANGGAGGNIQGVARSGGDPNLKPETARSFSFGVDYDLPVTPGAHLSLNYFDLIYKNQIDSYLNNRTVLLDEARYSSLLIRNPGAAFIQSLFNSGLTMQSGTAAQALAAALYVDGRQKNLGTTITRGLDIQLVVPFHTESAGDFRFSFTGTRFFTFKTSLTQVDEPTEKVNQIDRPQKFRFRSSLGWKLGGFQAVGYLNYINAYDNNVSTLAPRIGAYTSVDLSLSYTFPDMSFMHDLRIGVDASNLFDRDPPFADYPAAKTGAGGGYDGSGGASPIGRVISLSLSTKF